MRWSEGILMAVVEVVSYNGSPDVFAWKYPNSELGTWTQLIVNESQEAILFKGGKVCDVFQAGRHTLSTENIPILNNLVNLPFGGSSPFTAEVWFINKAFSLDIKWGTPSPIQVQDPKYKIFVPVRAFGQFGIQIEEPQKFLVKLVGNVAQFDKGSLLRYFRGVYLTKTKDAVSSYLIHKNISVLEINAYLDEISEFLNERIAPTFREYGIRLTSFFVNDINVPEDDNGVRKLKQALAKRAEMDIVGYNYQQERSFDTLEGAATNQGSMHGGLMGAGMGLGMGFGMGGSLGNQFNSLMQSINIREMKICPNCNSTLDKEARFCNNCGHDTLKKNQKKNKIKCSSCGAEMDEGSKFCMQCGNRYNSCVYCKADIPDGAAVCPVCGKKVPKACPGCGNILPENSKFCPACGYSAVKKCLACGKELDDNTRFCPECGTPVK